MSDRLAADEVLAVEYWRLALEELFAGIELTAEQQRQVDAIVAEASADRAQGRALQEKMIAAKREGNRERLLALGEELRAVQATFAPNERVDAMRALLAEDQLERFDRNRRLRGDRLVAEEQKEREGRQQLRRRPKAATPQAPAPPPECMDLVPVPDGERGSLSSGVRWTVRPRPESDGNYGRLEAVNLETGETAWIARQRAPQTTGTLVTGGGLVFAGALDRRVSAYDADTGDQLWQTRLNEVPSSAPISYAVGGTQYIAMVVGSGGYQSGSYDVMVPEIKNPPDRGAALWVFELP